MSDSTNPFEKWPNKAEGKVLVLTEVTLTLTKLNADEISEALGKSLNSVRIKHFTFTGAFEFLHNRSFQMTAKLYIVISFLK